MGGVACAAGIAVYLSGRARSEYYYANVDEVQRDTVDGEGDDQKVGAALPGTPAVEFVAARMFGFRG